MFKLKEYYFNYIDSVNNIMLKFNPNILKIKLFYLNIIGRIKKNDFIINTTTSINKKTDSMQHLIDETNRRRKIQEDFNKKNNIIPKSIKKSKDEILGATKVAESFSENEISIKRDIKTDKFLKEDKKIALEMIRQEMLEAAENLEFERAAVLRDEITNLEREINISK